MSFLTGLGSLAGGFNQTLAPLLQQYQNDTATGEGIYAMMGMAPPGASPSPALGGGLGAVAPPNVPVTSPQQTPLTPPLGQGGAARSPMPMPTPVAVNAPAQIPIGQSPGAMPQAQPSPIPTNAPPPIPASAPRNPSGGQQGVIPGQSAVNTAPPQYQAQQTAQVSPQVQQQQQNQTRQGPDLSHFDGQFDFNELLHNLVRQPGMTPEKVGRIARSPAFERMLTQQGLNQYRAIQSQLGVGRLGLGEGKLSLEAQKFKETTDRLERDNARRTEEHALDREELNLRSQYNAQNQRLIYDSSVADKGAAGKALDDAQSKALADIQKRREALTSKYSESSDSGDSGGGDLLAKAKAAIAAGKPKDAVIKRVKELDPNADTSGL